jgi:hypothetical protein
VLIRFDEVGKYSGALIQTFEGEFLGNWSFVFIGLLVPESSEFLGQDTTVARARARMLAAAETDRL